MSSYSLNCPALVLYLRSLLASVFATACLSGFNLTNRTCSLVWAEALDHKTGSKRLCHRDSKVAVQEKRA